MFGFLDQDAKEDEKDGRRRVGSEARGFERQCEVSTIFDRAGTGDALHLLSIHLSSRRIERGVVRRLDPEPTPFHRI